VRGEDQQRKAFTSLVDEFAQNGSGTKFKMPPNGQLKAKNVAINDIMGKDSDDEDLPPHPWTFALPPHPGTKAPVPPELRVLQHAKGRDAQDDDDDSPIPQRPSSAAPRPDQ